MCSWDGQWLISNLQACPVSSSYNFSLGFMMFSAEAEGFLSVDLTGLEWFMCCLTTFETHTYSHYRENACCMCIYMPSLNRLPWITRALTSFLLCAPVISGLFSLSLWESLVCAALDPMNQVLKKSSWLSQTKVWSWSSSQETCSFKHSSVYTYTDVYTAHRRVRGQ